MDDMNGYDPLDLIDREDDEEGSLGLPLYANNIELGIGEGVQMILKFHPLVSGIREETIVGNYMLSWETTARLFQSLSKILLQTEEQGKPDEN